MPFTAKSLLPEFLNRVARLRRSGTKPEFADLDWGACALPSENARFESFDYSKGGKWRMVSLGRGWGASLSEGVHGAGQGAREPGRVLGEFDAPRAHGLGIWSSGMILA